MEMEDKDFLEVAAIVAMHALVSDGFLTRMPVSRYSLALTAFRIADTMVAARKLSKEQRAEEPIGP